MVCSIQWAGLRQPTGLLAPLLPANLQQVLDFVRRLLLWLHATLPLSCTLKRPLQAHSALAAAVGAVIYCKVVLAMDGSGRLAAVIVEEAPPGWLGPPAEQGQQAEAAAEGSESGAGGVPPATPAAPAAARPPAAMLHIKLCAPSDAAFNGRAAPWHRLPAASIDPFDVYTALRSVGLEPLGSPTNAQLDEAAPTVLWDGAHCWGRFVKTAAVAEYLYKQDVDYIVRDKEVSHPLVALPSSLAWVTASLHSRPLAGTARERQWVRRPLLCFANLVKGWLRL